MSVDPKDLKDIRRDPDIEHAVESMPLTLILRMGDPVPKPSLPPPPPPPPGGAPAPAPSSLPTWGIKKLKADTSPFDGSGIKVAVLDTGIFPDHHAFQGLNIIGRNFIPTSSTDSTIDPSNFRDEHGHGTHCAGTIAGRDVLGIRIGVAPGIETLIVGKVLGPQGGSSAALLDAITWAISQGALIVSMSLGFDFVGLR